MFYEVPQWGWTAGPGTWSGIRMKVEHSCIRGALFSVHDAQILKPHRLPSIFHSHVNWVFVHGYLKCSSDDYLSYIRNSWWTALCCPVLWCRSWASLTLTFPSFGEFQPLVCNMKQIMNLQQIGFMYKNREKYIILNILFKVFQYWLLQP